MKKITLCTLILFSAFSVFGQKEKKAESKISNVTVFLNKAQVTREVKTRIQEGTTDVIITGLTAQLDPNSIQFSLASNLEQALTKVVAS